MPVLIRATITHDGELSARAHNRVMKGVMGDVGEHWNKHIKGRHFRSGAATKYGYQPRTSAWVKRKSRSPIAASDARLPLIFTGTLKRQVLRSKTIKAFPTRATVELQVPSYVTSRPNPTGRGRNRPNMGNEITAVTPDEIHELDIVAEKSYERRIQIEMKNGRSRKRITSSGVSG
jgi:hypothetical protein